MTRDEIEAALKWAEQVSKDSRKQAEQLWKQTGNMNLVLSLQEAQKNLSVLAAALREAWAEIDRLKAHLSNPLDEALNSGDGREKG